MSKELHVNTTPRDAASPKRWRMLIGKDWVDSVGGELIEAFNPADGTLIGSFPAANVEDVNRAVEAARKSFDDRSWIGLAPFARAKIMFRIADLIEQAGAELAHLEVLDNGMPLPFAQYVVHNGAEAFRYYGGWITKIHGITSEISSGPVEFHAYTLREPIGVAALIIPWNGPLLFACEKLAVALAAGCSCILKPAEETSLTALRLGQIVLEAGVSPGVVNIVTGIGETVGRALIEHPDVDKVGFTGSTEVGKAIVRAAAGNLKKVTLELGGKSPVVVFEDANMQETIPGVARGIFALSGQVCMAGSRVYVQRSRFDELIEGVAGIAKSFRIGNGLAPDVNMGPLISAGQLQRVQSLIQSGVDAGAELVTGGKRVGNQGYFVQPTVLANPPADARVVQEEIFGPVLAALPFDDLEDVVNQANATSYGLAAAIWTPDIKRAHRLAKRLRSGIVWLNCQSVLDMSLPFGGYKQSGWGREHGQEGLDAYLQTKTVFAAL